MSRRRVWEIGATAALVLALAGAAGGFFYLRAHYARVSQELAAVLDGSVYNWERSDMKAIRDLIQKGASIRTGGRESGTTALMGASYAGDADLVKELIARRAEVNARDHYGYTALMLAVRGEGVPIARTLLAGPP